jgi:O-6-methylguanine DNA methyltransferase
MPAIDWSDATPFQQAVWRALLEITPGQTQTYGEVARRIRKPRAARAVGTACGANPIPVLVPCHRVITAGGGLGGFSGGLDWKRRLLAIEAGSQSLS